MQWQFEEFRLDQSNQCLWHGDERMSLRPKTFDLLLYLIEHPDQLISKEELIEKIWVNRIVVESVLSTSITELRKVFGESAKQPRFIETVHRRGYRFIAPVSKIQEEQGAAGAVEPVLIGRADELSLLQQYHLAAAQGRRQMVFITGEAGIGKSELVNAFAAHHFNDPDTYIAQGQCIGPYGSGEPYLPLLDVLASLSQAVEGDAFRELLLNYAPSWLMQLPALTFDIDAERLKERTQGSTPERMLRELAEVLEALSVDKTLVLLIEDLHWCDQSTLQWLDYVVRRHNPCRLQILATFRPSEAIANGHPIQALSQDLVGAQLCHHLQVGYFSIDSVLTYLTQRHRRHQLDAALVSDESALVLHQRTNGNPLFLVTLVDALSQAEHPNASDQGIPDNLLQLIDRQLNKLDDDEKAFIEAASVAGKQFSAASIAAGTNQPLERVEDIGFALAHRQQFIRNQANMTWPDKTVSAGYVFIHDVFREGIYRQIPISKRSRWHLAIGERLEEAHQDHASRIAAELATHFAGSNNPDKAVDYFKLAGHNAAQLHAYQVAIENFHHALDTLAESSVARSKVGTQLEIQLALNSALVASEGCAANKVESAYHETLSLCRSSSNLELEFPALWGLWNVYLVRADFHVACDYADQLLHLAESSQHTEWQIEAHDAAAQSYSQTGELLKARSHLDQALALYDRQQHHSLAQLYGGEDPGLACYLYSAWTECLLGFPEKAALNLKKAFQLVEHFADPHGKAFALYFSALIHLILEDGPLLKQDAEDLLAVSEEYGLHFWLANGVLAQGWSLCQNQYYDEGLLEIRKALDSLKSSGAGARKPYFLAPMIDALIHLGQFEEALTIADEALVLCGTLGERCHEAELHRLKGEIILELPKTKDQVQASEYCFKEAIKTAQLQQAKFWELRSTVSLCRLWKKQGNTTEAHELLASLVEWFSEGFESAELKNANHLLVDLKSSA